MRSLNEYINESVQISIGTVGRKSMQNSPENFVGNNTANEFWEFFKQAQDKVEDTDYIKCVLQTIEAIAGQAPSDLVDRKIRKELAKKLAEYADGRL